MRKVCCFTGHRNLPKSEIASISRQMKLYMYDLYNQGVDTFITGGALGFDTLAALNILKMKEKFPTVKLILALPCRKQTKYWGISDREMYEKILRRADDVIYVSEEYVPDCMLKRNRYMVDNSDYCIAYCKRSSGGSAYTVRYAKKHGKTVLEINLFFAELYILSKYFCS